MLLDYTLTWVILSLALPSLLDTVSWIIVSAGLLSLLDHTHSPGLSSLLDYHLSYITCPLDYTLSWIILSPGLASVLYVAYPRLPSLLDFTLLDTHTPHFSSVIDYLSHGLHSLLDYSVA